MNTETIRTTIHSSVLKLGHVPDPTKPQWKGRLRDSAIALMATNIGIETIGFDLSYAQDRALHAVQLLLDETGYKGNVPSQKPFHPNIIN
jgi:hypothetical protein